MIINKMLEKADRLNKENRRRLLEWAIGYEDAAALAHNISLYAEDAHVLQGYGGNLLVLDIGEYKTFDEWLASVMEDWGAGRGLEYMISLLDEQSMQEDEDDQD